MKKFITILISASLGLAAVAMAQETEQTPGAGKRGKAANSESGAKATKSDTSTSTATGQETGQGKGKGKAATGNTETNANATGGAETGATIPAGKGKGARNRARTDSAESSVKPGDQTIKQGKEKSAVSAESTTSDTMGTETGAKGKRGKNARTETANATPGATINAQENLGKGKHAKNARAGMTPAPSASAATANASATVAPTASVAAATQTTTNATANQTNVNAGGTVAAGTNTGQIKGHGRNGKQVDQTTVQKIKTEHASFRAQPRPDKAPAVTFNANFRINGADRWQGSQYEVYRRYHPERHDQGWYHSHHNRVELIAGGYYYFDNGYWFPAWGYDPSAEYYAYDAPIYVGQHADRRPDQVIADVQAALQDMGYYQGEVDGLIGPLTREALVAYQTDNGLYATAVIDEPTLNSLDLGG